ncbi:MAG: sigma-70 family RNA polymerase sigma factor [Planctomycetota bacterium]
MSSESITRWFHQLRDGDPQAAEVLWKHFFPRLVELAQHRFGADRDPVYGPDDAAQSVFHLLCRGARQGRYQEIDGRDQLWRLLVTATRRKIIDRVRHNESEKRGGRWVGVDVDGDHAFEAVQPTPEMIVMMNESLEDLLASLRDDTLRRIVVCRLEGYTNAEIAEQLEVSQRTIERKLALIRGDWAKRLD